MSSIPKITALAPWFGSNRTLAPEVGKLLKGCRWVGVPFAGSMTELIYIDAPTLVVSDLHRHVINLAMVASSEEANRELRRRLKNTAFHPDMLSTCQDAAAEWNFANSPMPNIDAAYSYFVASWMGRSGNGGTDKEFSGKLPVRWTATGGDSCTRLRSSASSLREWYHVLRRANFVVKDAFDFLDEVKDDPTHGLYCDSPFPEVGDVYSHKFGERQLREFAERLTAYDKLRIVVRFYDHPLIRELYTEADGWKWLHFEGRKQSNAIGPEVLLVRNGAA